jgi:outer membrane biosynthesis protein TonB
MRRNFARWALRFLGLALGLGGGAAMLRGWDIVQVERGWAQFIAGAVALSGGAVVLALAEVVARLDRLLAAGLDAKATSAPQSSFQAAPPPPPEPNAAPLSEAKVLPEPFQESVAEPQPATPSPSVPRPPPAPLRVRREETPEPRSRGTTQAPPPPPQAEEPREIERYQAGGLTYVMYSDGSVELRSEAGAQRFSSLEELRTVLATQE